MLASDPEFVTQHRSDLAVLEFLSQEPQIHSVSAVGLYVLTFPEITCKLVYIINLSRVRVSVTFIRK